MNQAVLFNFALTRTDKDNNIKVFQLLVQPGSTWQEMYEILDEFKVEIKKEEDKALAAEAAKKAEAPIEPEVVNPVSE